MVNEAREALRALVLNQDINVGPYQVYAETPAMCAAVGQVDKGLFVVIESTRSIRAVKHDADPALLAALLNELTVILGPADDELRPWGGPLTWLALKAALTTGGNDAP